MSTDLAGELTPRQDQVIRLLDAGLNARSIAARLGLGTGVVYQYVDAAKKRLQRQQPNRYTDPKYELLTPRQIEVLAWLAEGKTREEVAIILNVKPRTVSFHVESARDVFGVATTMQAIVTALSVGLIQPRVRQMRPSVFHTIAWAKRQQPEPLQ